MPNRERTNCGDGDWGRQELNGKQDACDAVEIARSARAEKAMVHKHSPSCWRKTAGQSTVGEVVTDARVAVGGAEVVVSVGVRRGRQPAGQSAEESGEAECSSGGESSIFPRSDDDERK